MLTPWCFRAPKFFPCFPFRRWFVAHATEYKCNQGKFSSSRKAHGSISLPVFDRCCARSLGGTWRLPRSPGRVQCTQALVLYWVPQSGGILRGSESFGGWGCWHFSMKRFRGCYFGLFLETPSGSSGGRKPRIMWWRPKCWCSSEFAALADWGLVAFFSVFPECMQLFMHVFVACAGMSAASYESIDGMRA